MIQNDVLCEACCRQHGRTFETCNDGCHIRDLFEELKAERDAAVADLKVISPCYACKHADEPTESEHCFGCHGENWTWRGLSLAAETSDKEEE